MLWTWLLAKDEAPRRMQQAATVLPNPLMPETVNWGIKPYLPLTVVLNNKTKPGLLFFKSLKPLH